MSRQVKRKRSVCISVVTVILLISVLEVTSVGAAGPEARVIAVQSQDSVLPGTHFRVTIVVEYSDKLLVDVGIWDPQAGEMIRSVTLISSFTGPGRANFTFELTAPASKGTWNLLALTRVWFQDAWYQDPSGWSKPFTITITEPDRLAFEFTLSSQGTDTSIAVDAKAYQITSNISVSLQLAPGMHTLEAKQTNPGSPSARFFFAGWSDGAKSNPRQILVAQNMTITAIYKAEYYLSVTSDINEVSGTGWYEQGTQATFAVDPNYTVTSWFGYVTNEYHFSHWSGDSNSTSNIALVLMNGPKNVKAEWALTATTLDPIIIAYVSLFACLPLAARAIYLGTRKVRTRTILKSFQLRPLVSFSLIIIVLVGSLNVPAVRAEFSMQPKTSIVKIGDASWYYWNEAASDTCILWLGGGISAGTQGSNYWINPLQYESFGTIQFIQDLAKYYCVIALEQGSQKSFDTAANRTIYQEPYSILATIIADVHAWIRGQGYEHTFIVGYSVGGQAAVLEVALRDPQAWTSADGLILITVPVSTNVINAAQNIHPNLLFMYGGNLPDYEATGQEFYNQAPMEGSHGTYYYHKQFLVIQDVGHEVWTVRDTGMYTTKAANLVMTFIEKSKALQFAFTSKSTPTSTLKLTSVQVPRKIDPDNAFLINGTVSNPSSFNSTAALIAYEDASNESLSSAVADLSANSSKIIQLVIPPISNTSALGIDVVLLQWVGNQWLQAGSRQHVNFNATPLIDLRVQTSFPSVSLIFDGVTYRVPPNASIHFQTAQGQHSIQAQPMIEFGNATRLLFTAWDDGTASPQRTLYLRGDTAIFAIYRKQYFVNVTSPYGTSAGSGWYDDKSTATIQIQTPIDPRAEMIFSHWTADLASSDPRALVFVDSPKTVMAAWDSIRKPIQTESSQAFIVLALSLSALAVLLILNLRKRA